MIDLQKLRTDCREKLAGESLREKGMIQNENGSWIYPQEVIDNDDDWSGYSIPSLASQDAKMKEIAKKHYKLYKFNPYSESIINE